jgi:hypothetical protein
MANAKGSKNIAATQTENVNVNPSQDAPDTTQQDAPEQDATEPKQDATPEDTSPKLDELYAKRIELQQKYGELVLAKKFGTPELNKVGQDLFKLEKEIEVEQANIKKAKRDQEIKDAQNKQISLVTNFEELVIKDYKAGRDHAEGKITMEEANAINAAKKAAFDTIANQLIGKVSVPATRTASTGTADTTRGNVSKEILDRYKALRNEGKTDTDARRTLIKVEGFNDGTVGIVVKKYLREIGESD